MPTARFRRLYNPEEIRTRLRGYQHMGPCEIVAPGPAQRAISRTWSQRLMKMCEERLQCSKTGNGPIASKHQSRFMAATRQASARYRPPALAARGCALNEGGSDPRAGFGRLSRSKPGVAPARSLTPHHAQCWLRCLRSVQDLFHLSGRRAKTNLESPGES